MAGQPTSTIVAPLIFHGSQAPGKDKQSPADFWREFTARMESSATITTDEHRHQFLRSCLRGAAYDWYENHTRQDLSAPTTWNSLKHHFAFRFGISKVVDKKLGKYNPFVDHRQRSTESPFEYWDRLGRIYRDNVPMASYVPEAADTGITDAADQERARALVKKGIAEVTNYVLKHTWINGLQEPYHSIAARHAHKDTFKAITERMTTEIDLGLAPIDNPKVKGKNKKSIHVSEVQTEDYAEQSDQDEEVSAIPSRQTQRKPRCTFCSKQGHSASDCRKRLNNVKHPSASRSGQAYQRSGQAYQRNPKNDSAPQYSSATQTQERLEATISRIVADHLASNGKTNDRGAPVTFKDF